MNLTSLLQFFTRRKKQPPVKSDDYTALLWEDDYCQIEIVPSENKTFILKECEAIEKFGEAVKTDVGFTDMYMRNSVPVPTKAQELRADTFESNLSKRGLPKAKYIQYQADKLINTQTSKTKAYGFAGCTIFFETQDDFVENIWLSISYTMSLEQAMIIKEALYDLGESYELMLVDWNSLQVTDLTHGKQIENYLKGFLSS